MDVLLEIGENGPDLVLEGGDLALDLGISSAVLCSLFADRRAELEDDLPASETDPRGWCLEPTDDRWGSRLWLLERGKATTETVALARTAALQALAWLIEDGIAETVDARVELAKGGQILLEVDVQRGRARRWPALWEGVQRGETVRNLGAATLRILTR